jgi:hypothetical protein
MITKIKLLKVDYMPAELQSGILYVAEQFGAAAHLCACGCGTKIRTPLGPTEWSLKETSEGPSLYPSIGNWQIKCQSHYWIREGGIKWSDKWTEDEIAAGRVRESRRREMYYGTVTASQLKSGGIWEWFKGLFKQ